MSLSIKSPSISRFRELLDSGQLSAVELAKEYLDRAESVNSTTNAFISINRQNTLAQARTADKVIKQHRQKLLTGIPYGMKDTYLTKNIKTTAGSKVLANYLGQYNATVTRKLNDQNAVLIGKHNQDAWGHGASNENSDYGPVRNPYDLSRVAGGSSGGTAASIATDTVVFGIGEDTGGSIRLPSSFCNISGLKVTYGRVSRYGAIAYASSLDTVGPMAHSVKELAQVLSVIAGPDPLDASSSNMPVPDYLNKLNRNKTLVIGIPQGFFDKGIDEEVKTSVLEAISKLERMGHKIVEINIASVKYALAVYYLLATAETSSNLGRYDAIRYGTPRAEFTLETKRRILMGTYVLSAGYYDKYYNRAQKLRTQIIREFAQIFRQVDAIVAPVSPTPSFKLGSRTKDPLEMYLSDIYTVIVNLAGLPALAIPTRPSQSGLPIGMQIIGPLFAEAKILSLGHQFQQATKHHLNKPQLK